MTSTQFSSQVAVGTVRPASSNISSVVAHHLLTSEEHDSFENHPWIVKLVDFTKTVLAQNRVRMIGVCFGHQIVARALEVKVGRSNRGWEASVCKVDLTPKGKELFGRDQLMIHQMHRDIVYDYPPTVERLGTSPICEVQGMYTTKRLITVQGHPEFNEQIVRELLATRHEQGIFDDVLFRDMIGRVANEHDGVAVAGAFLKFLLDDR